jgi:sugar phosphate permease
VSAERLTRHFILLRALRWLPTGLVLPFLIITPASRGLSLGAIGAVFAVHSAVAILLEVPSGALADSIGRRRVLLAGAFVTALSLVTFALAQGIAAFMVSVALLAAGRAFVSGSLEAWYVDSLRLLDPIAPLGRGLSRGTAAEGIAMALGALVGGALVALADPDGGSTWALAGYGLAALAGGLAALVYLAAVATLVHEAPDARSELPARGTIGQRMRDVFATARAEAAASVTVRIVFITGTAFGVSLTVTELLWQPRLADLLGGARTEGLAFGALAAASMLAVALGAGLSPTVNRRLGLRLGYLAAIALAALCVATMGAPDAPIAFATVYLLAYLGFGVAEPMHYELLNDAVGSTARATLISAESLATQGGALVANLSVGALAAAQGSGAAWAVAGALLALTAAAIARPLLRI